MGVEDNHSESTPPAPESPPISGEQSVSLRETPWYDEFLDPKLRDDIAKIAATPYQPRDPKVWGVLTAVSYKARKRKQCLNMVLKENVHSIGRLVEDYPFRIDSKQISGAHCKIYRQTFASEDDALKSQPLVFLKDNSSNGTYVNWIWLRRRDDAVQIHHGDLISFITTIFNVDIAYTFVYREAVKSAALSNGVVVTQRKAEECASEIKRVKGIGLGAPKGPIISLDDDFRSLQLSNTEPRKQLDEMKNQIKELQDMLDAKHKELVEAYKLSADQKHTIDDLKGSRLGSLSLRII